MMELGLQQLRLCLRRNPVPLPGSQHVWAQGPDRTSGRVQVMIDQYDLCSVKIDPIIRDLESDGSDMPHDASATRKEP